VNPACQGIDPRIKILNNCGTKPIGTVLDVPKTRCCVTCGFPIEHSAACKHMACTLCNTDFCFVCLKPRLNNGDWQCGNSNTVCAVAPIQTTLAKFKFV